MKENWLTLIEKENQNQEKFLLLFGTGNVAVRLFYISYGTAIRES
jgi:hypothetical protein